jgi:hypothetical protein
MDVSRVPTLAARKADETLGDQVRPVLCGPRTRHGPCPGRRSLRASRTPPRQADARYGLARRSAGRAFKVTTVPAELAARAPAGSAVVSVSGAPVPSSAPARLTHSRSAVSVRSKSAATLPTERSPTRVRRSAFALNFGVRWLRFLRRSTFTSIWRRPCTSRAIRRRALGSRDLGDHPRDHDDVAWNRGPRGPQLGRRRRDVVGSHGATPSRRTPSPRKCTGGESNPYASRRRNLNPLRLPVSPPVR